MNEWEWQLLEDKTALDELEISGAKVRAGNRVRLHPRKGGDILDLALSGQQAVIEAIEQDYEGKCHVCVVLDEDPGRDMGLLRQPGHRFFFDPEELEPLPGAIEQLEQKSDPNSRILIAGIGNIFLGDDAFGVEVVRRLSDSDLPSSVRVADFGIRGLDLSYALQDGYDMTILVDACPRGQAPGTVYLIEPDLNNLNTLADQESLVDAHSMNPVSVLRMAKGMNAQLKRVVLVGCEPASLGGEEGQIGLSEPVQAALEEAVAVIRSLVAKTLDDFGTKGSA
jgi:hydrogenase maturation protease